MPENTLKSLENMLTLSSLRQKVLAKNIANINNEYYKREVVTFDEYLTDGLSTPLKATDSNHIGYSEKDIDIRNRNLRVIEDPSADFNSGTNNVDIDKEMAELAENQILFKFASRKINMYFKTLQEVIKGGR